MGFLNGLFVQAHSKGKINFSDYMPYELARKPKEYNQIEALKNMFGAYTVKEDE